MKTAKKEIFWFLAINFILTEGIGLWFLLFKPGLEGGVMAMTMFIPALSVFFVYKVISKKPYFKKSDIGFRFINLKYWIIAPLLMIGYVVLSYVISWMINPAVLLPVKSISESLQKTGFYWGSIYPGLAVLFVVNVFVGAVINIPIFLGEEIGWRGFLYPRLRLFFSPGVTFLIGGTIWGLWHTTMIAMGLNYPGHLVGGILMMILMTIPMGMIIYYFYYRSKSVWVAGLAHAGVNRTAAMMAFLFDQEHINPFLYGPTGIVGITLLWIVAIFLYQKFLKISLSEEMTGLLYLHNNSAGNKVLTEPIK